MMNIAVAILILLLASANCAAPVVPANDCAALGILISGYNTTLCPTCSSTWVQMDNTDHTLIQIIVPQSTPDKEYTYCPATSTVKYYRSNANFSALPAFTNLQAITIKNSSLSAPINLSPLQKLNFMSLTQLKGEVSISNLLSLTNLLLSDLPGAITVSNLPALKDLYLDTLPLSDVSFDSFSSLTSCKLYGQLNFNSGPEFKNSPLKELDFAAVGQNSMMMFSSLPQSLTSLKVNLAAQTNVLLAFPLDNLNTLQLSGNVLCYLPVTLNYTYTVTSPYSFSDTGAIPLISNIGLANRGIYGGNPGKCSSISNSMISPNDDFSCVSSVTTDTTTLKFVRVPTSSIISSGKNSSFSQSITSDIILQSLPFFATASGYSMIAHNLFVNSVTSYTSASPYTLLPIKQRFSISVTSATPYLGPSQNIHFPNLSSVSGVFFVKAIVGRFFLIDYNMFILQSEATGFSSNCTTPDSQLSENGVVCSFSPLPSDCYFDSYCTKSSSYCAKIKYKGRGMTCLSSNICNGTGACITASEDNSEYLLPSDCTRIGYMWCEELGRCAQNCSFCIEASQGNCTGSCKWCDTLSLCLSDTTSCPTCDKLPMDSCNNSCTWCENLQSCLPSTPAPSNCKKCSTIASASCSSSIGCIPCGSNCRPRISSSTCGTDSYCTSTQTFSSITLCACESIADPASCDDYPGCKLLYGKCVSKTTSEHCHYHKQNGCGDPCVFSNQTLVCSAATTTICVGRTKSSCEFVGCSWCDSWCSSSCSPQSKENSSSTILIIIIACAAGGAFVVVILVSMIVLLKRRNKDLSETAKFGKSTSLSQLGTGVDYSDKSAGTSLPSFSTDLSVLKEVKSPREMGLLLSEDVITFNCGNQLKVHSPFICSLRISNQSNTTLEVGLQYIPDEDPHKCSCSPSQFTLGPDKFEDIRILLEMTCTSKLQTYIAIVCSENQQVFKVPLVAESEASCYLSLKEIDLGKMLGKGAFGQVYMGKYRGETVAVKQMQSEMCFDGMNIERDSSVDNEIQIMSRIRSPYIVNFFGAVYTKQYTFIVMEFCQYGTLTSLYGKKNLNPELKVKMCLDCARGMAFLHQNKIIHRDLKPDNLLLVSLSSSATIRAKISDFGTGRMVSDEYKQKMTKGVGTPIYMAPELLRNEMYSMPSDVYAFALVMWSVWHETEPYKGIENNFEIYQMVLDGKRLNIPVDCTYGELVTQCWNADPSERPTFKETIPVLCALAGVKE
eukprot:TRINITY_DN281_c4_g1_i1.p1 TRINITY_DN281_c4_g1~~TRINITY_DN281_c4_g1_i1.p1  ORF type:complete len:1240 (+),score=268.39 TRINITY_DN281_c4_g1_i1:23-3721(+)